MIVLVDFGGQTAHLITRRIRELGVDCKIVTPEDALYVIANNDNPVRGIIFSGGPASVYEKDAPTIDKKIFDLQIPILGICYGQQLLCQLLDGEVKAGFKKEFGPAILSSKFKVQSSKLLKGIPDGITVWMSHGDEVVKIPAGFETVPKTKTIPHAVIENHKKKIYGIQFHPEVIHTELGEKVLENFIKECGLQVKKQQIDKTFVENIISDIKDSTVDDKAICALSGGVDSSVAALLAHQAIGNNLTCLYIDSGLMRDGETDTLKKVFASHFHMNIQIIDAKKEFLNGLKGVSDPEQKRKIIGRTFIQIFEKEAKKVSAKFLVQGTIYPDVIESAGGSKH